MNLGNHYILAYQDYQDKCTLLLEELPTMVTVEDYVYSIELSPSYTGNLYLPAMNESVPFVMPLILPTTITTEAFHSFLLTIEYNTVSIFSESTGVIKVFDSHARDSFGMPHPHGTCVVLEFDSVDNLIEYLKFLYRPDVIYESKGVKYYLAVIWAENVDANVISMLAQTNQESSQSFHCNSCTRNSECNSIFNTQSYYIFYIIPYCFSTIKRCNYWNYQTENAIVEHAIELFNERLNETHLSTDLQKAYVYAIQQFR